MHQDSDDHRLLAQLAAGEMSALEELYDRHAQVALAVILRIVGDRSTAEDLLQEAMLQLWRNAGRYDGRVSGVRPWLLGISHNLALNELRRRRRHPQNVPATRQNDESSAMAIVDETANPETTAWDRARRDVLVSALGELPGAQQEIITLYADGYSQSEIAARLDQPLGTVKTRMRRGLKQLRDALHHQGADLR